MPDLLRRIFLPESDRGSALDAGAGALAPRTAVDLMPAAAVWQAVPAALALYAGGEVVDCNPACVRLLREVVGNTETGGRRWLAAAAARLLASGRAAEILAGSDDSLSLEVRLGPITPGADTRLLALREVTVHGRGEDDLVETVSTLSHELRTPLASMKSSLRLVLSGETGDVNAEQTRFLDMTMRNIDRLERLVSDLLDVSRTQSHNPLLRRRDCDLGPVLREAVQMHEAAARQAGLELDYSGLPANFAAHVDPDKVVQILTNVVGNSLKYTPRGGLVRVWLESRPRFRPDSGPALAWRLAEEFFLPLDTFNLVVEDSGIGLSPMDQTRVFEPWFRAGAQDRLRAAGAGLGLHITRALVEAHGGRIRLASEAGQGTTVWIRLPRDPDSENLLQSARRLRELAAGGCGDQVAVLDGRAKGSRPAVPVLQLATDFLSSLGLDADRRLSRLAPDLVATVVDEAAGWHRNWKAQAESGRQVPDWRLVTVTADV